jgi:class 3 adenylate cyclase
MESPKRRLSAVWFADIVGYSTLSERDEPAALRLVTTLQTLSGEIVGHFEGRIVKFIGDAVLSEFASSDSALRSAVTLQERYVAATAALGLESRLRIGVHVGEVNATPDGDLYGDGINMAARLHQKATPGQVIISEDVWRLLRARPEFRFEPLGEVELKGITTRVGIYDVLFGARAALEATRAPAGGARPRRAAGGIAAATVVLLAGVVGIYTSLSDQAPDSASSPVPPPAQAAATPPAAATVAAAAPTAVDQKREAGQKSAPPVANGRQGQPEASEKTETPEKTEPSEKPPSLQAADLAAVRALLDRLAAALTSERPQQAMPTLGPGAAMVVLKGSSQMKAAFGAGLSVRVGRFEAKEIDPERIGIRLILLARSDSRPETPLVFTALVRRFGGEMRFADLQRDWDAEGRGGRRGRGGGGKPRG